MTRTPGVRMALNIGYVDALALPRLDVRVSINLAETPWCGPVCPVVSEGTP